MTRMRFLAAATAVVSLASVMFAAGPASAREVLRANGVHSATRAAAAPPVTWCGSGPSPIDRDPSVEISSPNQIHVVYAVPSDAPDRFAALASPIATDIAAIDAWWQKQDPTRTPRFDLFPYPHCSPRYGMLDLGFARLPHPTAYYYGPGGELRLGADLDVFAHSARVKNLVFYDGSLEDPDICGSTDFLASNDGGRFGFAFVYLQSGCPNDTGRGEFTARVAAHELLHNLGAERFVGWSGSCTGIDPCTTSMDAAKSVVAQFAPAAIRVSVTRKGRGKIVSTPAGIACPSRCTATFTGGTVGLRAKPAKGYRFAGWSGDCRGKSACVLSTDADHAVAALFRKR